jgi:hypothetical protein
MLHKHHIIPRHAGGSDDPSNIVELTVAEHAQAHKELYRKHGRKEDFIAWKGLSGMLGKEDIIAIMSSNPEASRKGGLIRAKTQPKNHMSKMGKAAWTKSRDKMLNHLREHNKNIAKLGGKAAGEAAKRRAGTWYWITNGVDSTQHLKSNNIPEGWYKGRTL